MLHAIFIQFGFLLCGSTGKQNRYLPIAMKQAANRPAPALQISLVKKYTAMAVIPLLKKGKKHIIIQKIESYTYQRDLIVSQGLCPSEI